MKKTKLTLLIFALLSICLGTLLHFVYDFSQNEFFRIIGAINESTWEHLKLIFYPMFIFGFAIFIYLKPNINDFVVTYLISILVAMFTTVATFYIYQGILGFNLLFIDILTFIIGIGSGYYYLYRNINYHYQINSSVTFWIGISGIFLLLLMFIIFTYYPPHIGLFKDPVFGKYGPTK